MRKVFKPFWSLDVEATERWLSEMGVKGYHFVKVNTKTSSFFFKEGPSQELQYRIVYNKKEHYLPTLLENDGWEELFEYKSWRILMNEKPQNEGISTPNRDGMVEYNTKRLYILGFISIYMVASLAIFLLTIGFSLIIEAEITIVSSPYWVFTFLFWLLGVVLFIAFVKLFRSNKKIKNSIITPLYFGEIDSLKENELKKAGKVIVKRKFIWMYAPDKYEAWLENMERQGYNLYRVKWNGTKLFFKKGTPRKVKYCADYQHSMNDSYFEMHQDAGWNLLYRSNATLSKWAIWSCVYEEGEEIPQFYHDKENKLGHAKRVTFTQLLIFVPLLIMYLTVVVQHIYLAFDKGVGLDWSQVFMLVTFCLIIVEFGLFSLMSWLYYKRVKNNLSYT